MKSNSPSTTSGFDALEGGPSGPVSGADGPARRPRGSAERRYTSEYAELSRQVRAARLLRRRPLFYLLRVVVLVLLFAATGWAFLALGDSWWQLATAAVLGLLLTQVAYLSHDAAHRQIFSSGKWNERAALLLGDVVVGLSYGWWMSKHSRHHANPNKVDVDPDIEPAALVFSPDEAAARHGRRSFSSWWVKRQGTLFFPLLLLAGLNLHVSSIRTVFGRGHVKHRAFEIPVLVARLTLYPVVLFAVLSPGLAVAFLGVQLAVFGLSMGSSFAPNHKGMPVVPRDLSVDFLRRQVLTSRNVRGGRFVDIAMGGLNYQIEHHLFPNMPLPGLRAAQPMVKQFCAEHGIAYTEAGLVESWRIVVRHLNRVGRADLDPFQCPLAAQLRAPV
ncbi:fatty acid desaturase family protein [Phytoactinopolyspora halotolerans]|uniref:Acyl-CoA desaturase n=1 Tax=Phytoactinopolyspora halotolerans TaxID=1981512 RepID=A0A6L9SEC2_9ACTN|nr:acyl-CoA desaturase [Phytoactinopolyspora halotolerans]NEE03493.1 acyl-CoA desaturase [Phytoactinopolyspora halotolerans]